MAVMSSSAKNETLLAVTEDGFVQYPLTPEEISQPKMDIPSPEHMSLFHALIRQEPTAAEVHRAVIRYGNLKNWKMRRWHGESRLRALLPTLSYGRDFSRSNNMDIDRGSTTSPDVFIEGSPDIANRWNADVHWDLGDLVWSSNQTSIDSREKLMVELRHDFLSEATRIYYERRRLQMETVFASAVSERDHLERLLRLEELTSLLDSMTDGFMTKRLERVYQEKPEFEKLWEYQPQSSSS
jgi:hypothetical protein